jgi:hypothetical protein
VHDPDFDLPVSLRLDGCLPDVFGVHPVDARHDVQAALVTFGVEEDGDAGERGAVLECGDANPCVEQCG